MGFSFLRFYKSKIQIRNAITTQTEDTIGVEADKYKNVVDKLLNMRHK